MAQDNRKFDKKLAGEVADEYETAKKQINATVELVRSTLLTLDSWWTGESADAFVKLCEKMELDVKDILKTWLQSHQNLIREIETMKTSGERRISDAISSLY